MATLFEKLFELMQAFWSYIIFWHVLGDDECGLIRRLGKYHRDMKPGWNWKLPLAEQPMSETAALGSSVLREQSLTTKDGKPVTLRGVVTWRVTDARKFILDCDSAQSVITDVGCGVIAELVPDFTAEEILSHADSIKQLRKTVRERGKKWGITIEYFGLVDCVQARTYRIITSDHHDGPGLRG